MDQKQDHKMLPECLINCVPTHGQKKGISNVDDTGNPLDVETISRSCTKREKVLTIFLVVFLVLNISLLALIFAIFRTSLSTFLAKNGSKVCYTAECISVSAQILGNMNRSVDPCSDFYSYACGNFAKHSAIPPDKPRWTTFHNIYEEITRIFKKVLEEDGYVYKGKNSSAVRKVKSIYHACMDVDHRENLGPKPMLELIKELGSWSITNDPMSSQWDENSWSMVDTLVKLHRYNINPLFSISVSEDPKNSSKNIVQFIQDGLSLDTEHLYLSNNTAMKIKKAFSEFQEKIIGLLGASVNESEKYIQEIIDFEINLARIYVPKDQLQDPTKIYHKMTVKDLKRLTDIAFNMKDYMDKLFNDDVPLSEEIIVFTPSYMQKMAHLVHNTNKRILANYMVWQSVSVMTPLLSVAFQNAKKDFRKVIDGVRAESQQWLTCVVQADELTGFITGALYIEENFPKEMKEETKTMMVLIKEMFIENLPSVKWMDPMTQSRAEEKAKAVIEKVGYPDWIETADGLDAFYYELETSELTNFRNYLNVAKFGIGNVYKRRLKKPDKTRWEMTPGTVNAYYSPSSNQIAILAAILKAPFYDASFPKSLNFGGIGMVMGHEFSHGFDTIGRHYDKDGNMANWWLNDTAQSYNELAHCFMAQYSNYSLGDKRVNGLLTLSENIADNAGVRLAFKAYCEWKELAKTQLILLPGLDLNDEQLFFLGFAQTWCTFMTPEYAEHALNVDVHSPGKYRVIGPLSNSLEFADVFNCEHGSVMNPQNKCRIW